MKPQARRRSHARVAHRHEASTPFRARPTRTFTISYTPQRTPYLTLHPLTPPNTYPAVYTHTLLITSYYTIHTLPPIPRPTSPSHHSTTEAVTWAAETQE
ncbi:hypothetical protein E2C01_052770 [Portunus trituberculatus]|uniref:Uncharacterized protein n=1 Tax=Portunus trituberculatus TaxID=210409 RepID=A0A5B7GFH9_PORTR|nr:hypothetical protein [Portunus trituberculatus]